MIVNKYSKFQMDTFYSFWEMDSNKQLNRPRRRRWSDDNSSTFFLRKVKLKKDTHCQMYTSKEKNVIWPVLISLPLFKKVCLNCDIFLKNTKPKVGWDSSQNWWMNSKIYCETVKKIWHIYLYIRQCIVFCLDRWKFTQAGTIINLFYIPVIYK